MKGTTRIYEPCRRGSVLIITMVVVFAIAAMVLTLGRQVRVQALASANDLAAQKADAAERGAEQYVLSLLSDQRDSLPTLTETEFSAVPVGDAFFWVVRPTYDDANLPAWGLLDESAKIDLNTATPERLLAVPGMTQEIGDAIVAWRGPVATSTDTSSSTTVLPDSGVKNAPFESVDELMLVPGVTRAWLYGTAGPGMVNGGGRAAGVVDGATASAASNVDEWTTAHGVFDFFTVWNTLPNTDPAAAARVSFKNPTDTFATTMDTLLPGGRGTDIATQINRPIGPPSGRNQAQRRTVASTLVDIFSLADTVSLTADEFATIESYLTNDATKTTLPGLINVNAAPRQVLLALTADGLSETNIDTLLNARTEAVALHPASVGWVHDAIPDIATTVAGLGNSITGQGRQYSADIVAANGNGRGFRHVRIVVDSTSTPARVVYRRDLTDRGWPLDPALLDQLKAGTFAGGNGSGTASGTAAGTPAAGVR